MDTKRKEKIMKKTRVNASVWVIGILLVWALLPFNTAFANQALRYSCSAQVFEAFENSRLDAFTKETGIPVELHIASSAASIYRVMQDMTDVASSTRPIYKRYEDYGLVEMPFCKDPLAIITHMDTTVNGLTRDQLQQIFSGNITNWKAVGGKDLPIVLVVPGENTGAYENFKRQVMQHQEIQYDYMANKSTHVLTAIESLPVGAVSFISRGAQITHPKVKVLSIDGEKPGDKNYPFYQIFYLVSNGAPTGAVKTFSDFIKSEKGKSIIIERGMLPID